MRARGIRPAMRAVALAACLILVPLAGCTSSQDAPGTGPVDGGNGGAATPAPEPVELAVATTAPYSYSPATLSVAEGALVNLTYTNSDPVPIQQHDWVLDGADVATDVVGVGASTSVTFTAPEAGTYEFYCSVGSHRALGMRGTLTVT